MLLISLHLPKTAGTSLRAVLHRRFGAAFLADYGDLPLNTPRPHRECAALLAGLRQAIQRGGMPAHITCVHGHFLPLKYRWMPGRPRRFATWLRDPVDRLASHYAYWMQADARAALPPLHRKVIEQGWTLEQFCLSRELRNVYHQFLFGFPIENFAFIGIVERMEQDFAVFQEHVLDDTTDATPPHLNATDGPRIGAGAFRRRVEAFHAEDMTLYRAVLARGPLARRRAGG